MFPSLFRSNRIAVAATIAISIAIASLGIVRAAQRFVVPAMIYTCSTGAACVEGKSTGTPLGVLGTSSGGTGVEGTSSAAKFAGVSGLQSGNDGIGVYAESSDTSGKYAALFARGVKSATDIFYGYNSSTHASCLIDFNADLSCKGSVEASPLTNSSIAIMGTSGSNYGVEGYSQSADGVHGITYSSIGNSAVAGIAYGTSGSSNGVYGSSYNGPGVYGNGNQSYGVEGVSTGSSGVFGEFTANASGAGVTGTSTKLGFGVIGNSGQGGAGVEGYSTQGFSEGVLAYASAPADIALLSQSESNGVDIFDGLGPDNSSCAIDSSANLSCTGTITGAIVRSRHRTGSGGHVLAYASESTSETLEDFGTARMVHGTANVQIQPTFASAIDRNSSYYVFLTPLGDTRGLYVSLKTPSSFQVRETEGGHSSLGFDYRIVAHPADAGSDRLPQAPAIKRPLTPHIPQIRLPRAMNSPRPPAHR